MISTIAYTETSCAQVAALGSAGTLHVDGGYDGGSSDGSQEKPFKTIQAAIDAAKEGSTIAVAQGRYEDGNIELKGKGLVLLGGYVGGSKGGKAGDFATRDPKKYPTVVIGKRDTSDYRANPAAVFLYADTAGGKIDGFTISGGRHGIFTRYSGSKEALVISNNIVEENGVETPNYDELGGGVHTEYQKVIVENNIIRKNRGGRGGGLAVMGAGEVLVQKNIIENNVGAGDHGGGMWISQNGVVRDNLIRGNEIIGAIINWLGGVGGGVVVVSADVTFSHNVITDNYAKKCGGGVFVDDAAHVKMDHELIVRNRPAHKDGMGGSGIYVDGSSDKTTTLDIQFSTIADNAPGGPGKGNGIYVTTLAEVTVQSSIFWHNGSGDDFNVDDTKTAFVAASYSLWTGNGNGVRAGEGQLSKDPLFASPDKLDYHLRTTGGRWDPRADGAGAWVSDKDTSPAIDAAAPAAAFTDEPAPNGGRANLGFEGGTAEASTSAGGQRPTTPPPAASSVAWKTDTGTAAPPVGTGDPKLTDKRSGGCAGCVVTGVEELSGAVAMETFLIACAAVALRKRRRGPPSLFVPTSTGTEHRKNVKDPLGDSAD